MNVQADLSRCCNSIFFSLQELESEIDVMFPRPKPPMAEAATDSLSSDAGSNKSGNQSSEDDKGMYYWF